MLACSSTVQPGDARSELRLALDRPVDAPTTRDSSRSRRRRLMVVVILAELTCILRTCTARYSGHGRVVPDGTRNFSPNAAMRARPVVDLDLRRLTVTGIPPAAWQVLDQYRRRDLAASRAEDREPTIERWSRPRRPRAVPPLPRDNLRGVALTRATTRL